LLAIVPVSLVSLIEGFQFSEQSLQEYIYSYDWASRVDTYQSGLINLNKNYHYVYDSFLIDTQGNILFTVDHKSDFGTNLFTGKYSGTQLSKVSKNSLESKQLLFSDVESYIPSAGRMDSFIISPIKSEDGSQLGLMAIQVRIDDIFDLLNKSNQHIGAQHYLIGEDGLLRSFLKGRQLVFLKQR
jgi:hypothetical protein